MLQPRGMGGCGASQLLTTAPRRPLVPPSHDSPAPPVGAVVALPPPTVVTGGTLGLGTTGGRAPAAARQPVEQIDLFAAGSVYHRQRQ